MAAAATKSAAERAAEPHHVGQRPPQDIATLLKLHASAGNRAVARLLGQVRTELDRPGEELDFQTRTLMEQQLGREVGDVRVHADADAARAAEAVNAKAFTVGRHVVFGSGAYDPSSAEGRRVLAHELAHVSRQSEGSVAGVMPPGAPAERAAAAGATAQSAAATTGIARIQEKNLTQLDDAGLMREHQLAQEWIAKHPTGAEREAGVQYMNDIEAMVGTRAAAPAAGRPSYQAMSDEQLWVLARQGHADAASEVFARARNSPGYTPQPAGGEEFGPGDMPEFIGPELPPYQSGKTPLRSGDIEELGAVNTRARVGDKLEGHEPLQNAFLLVKGWAVRRGKGLISRRNPTLVVSEDFHPRLDAAQRELGLFDRDRLAAMTPEEVISENMRALETTGVERSKIEMIRREALAHAARSTPVGGENVPAVGEMAGPAPEVAGPAAPPAGGEAAGGRTWPAGSSGALFQLSLGIFYAVAHAQALAQKRDTEGWVPVGPDPNESRWTQIARWMMDPSLDDAIPAVERLNLPVKRKSIRERAGRTAPGQKLLMVVEREKLNPSGLSHDSFPVEYVKQPDGTFGPGRVLDDDYKDYSPLDLNRLIDPSVPDESIMYRLKYGKSGA